VSAMAAWVHYKENGQNNLDMPVTARLSLRCHASRRALSLTSYPARAHTRLPLEAGGPLACAGDALGESARE
jgi:hypothetical protein